MTNSRIILVGEELPPMEPPRARPERNGQQHTKKPKGKSEAPKRLPGERFAMLNAFVDFAMAELKPSERAVWLVLFRDTKQDGIARTSERDIARRAGYCVRMVRYALSDLQRCGLVMVVRRGRLQTGPSSYRVRALTEQHA